MHLISIYECRDQLRRAMAESRTVRHKMGDLGYVPKYEDPRPYSETLRRLLDEIGDDDPTPLPLSAHDTQPGMPAVREPEE